MGYMETSPGLREVWRFREVIKNFVSQDLKVKYRRSFLGFFWSLLNPLLQMAVITVVFSLIFKFTMKLYALYVLSGLVPWSFWATSVDGCCMSIVSAESMLKRQYFPKLVFPISVIMQNLVTFVLSLAVLLLVLAPVTGYVPSAALLVLPLSFLCLVGVSLGVGMVAAVATVYFRDLQHLISVALNALFYLTPIIYPLETAGGEGPIPHRYRYFFKLNPMYSIIEMFHRPIYEGRLPTNYELIVAVAVASVTLGVGLLVFRRYENSLIFNL
jgi:ABC-2 type transport system permease protein/lipopolysaccharide transport system permease protein